MSDEAHGSPIVIIGAGRSGTNMLRDLLVRMPGQGTWPCDEINYIWRHGNARYPTDEFSADLATDEVAEFIRQAFSSIAKKQRLDRVVEKTCANSLRVRFVDRVLPDAQYIYIVRDGRDVVASAMKRWTASLDLPYILRKARYVPAGDVPYYASNYLLNHMHRLRSGEKQLAAWGPRFEGMAEARKTKTLAEICALQWRRCVERSDEDLALIPSERIQHMRYEAFVREPSAGIRDLADFLDVHLSISEVNSMAQSITAKSVGKWRDDLAAEEVALIEPILEPALHARDYV